MARVTGKGTGGARWGLGWGHAGRRAGGDLCLSVSVSVCLSSFLSDLLTAPPQGTFTGSSFSWWQIYPHPRGWAGGTSHESGRRSRQPLVLSRVEAAQPSAEALAASPTMRRGRRVLFLRTGRPSVCSVVLHLTSSPQIPSPLIISFISNVFNISIFPLVFPLTLTLFSLRNKHTN